MGVIVRVGLDEGGAVGGVVSGDLVGGIVGLVDGDAVGDLVGGPQSVGLIEGGVVGDLVGGIVGDTVGLVVGVLEKTVRRKDNARRARGSSRVRRLGSFIFIVKNNCVWGVLLLMFLRMCVKG